MALARGGDSSRDSTSADSRWTTSSSILAIQRRFMPALGAVARDEEGGVFKSTDGGQHWKLLEGTKKLSIRSLAIAPSDSAF